jgi:hypothetical protein
MSDQTLTPRTDANSWVETNRANALTLASFSMELELELNQARNAIQETPWHANGESKESWFERQREKYRHIERERDEAQEEARIYLEQLKVFEGIDADRVKFKRLSVELQDALIRTLSSLIIRMGPEDSDTVERAHQALGKAKQLLKL